MIFTGIDPGASGAAYAVELGPTSIITPKAYLLMPMLETGKRVAEVDVVTLADWLRDVGSDFTTVENVGYMPAGKSSFGGSGFSDSILSSRVWEIVGMLKALKLAYTMVGARTWQTALGLKLTKVDGELPRDRKKRVKKATQAFCTQRYPHATLIPERCRVPHEGLVDALAIAHWTALRERAAVKP